MTEPSTEPARRPRLAILSYSSGEYDARSFRVASSAIAAGYEVTMYSRWHPGQPPVEQRDGYLLIRADIDWRLAVPLLRGGARRRSAARMAEAARLHEHRATDGGALEPDTGEGVRARGPEAPGPGWGNHLLWPLRLVVRAIRKVARKVKRWRGIILMFPLRPLGWSVALESVVRPADLWHGMWAGSLPAIDRMRRLHGGRTIYDSRDVYMQSRDFSRLEWPIRPILERLERRWAQRADRVLTVNDPYADLIARQLCVPRPPVVMNTSERWVPPDPAPDLIREATGVPAELSIVLYQGQLTTERGIEQAMDAILQVPGAVLVLLGFGSREEKYRALAADPPYAGRVFLLPAVPPSDLLDWTASADVMVMPIQPTTPNHEFTTPQKLWEAIAAGVPVVASDLPGMAGVIRAAGVGVLCDPTSPVSIARGIRQVLDQSPRERAATRAHVLAMAHQRYNWESQVEALFGLYGELGAAPPAPDWRDSLAAPASTSQDPGDTRRTPGGRLRFAQVPPADGRADEPETTLVVLDTAWTPTAPDADSGLVLLRDVVERIMRERDLIADAATALDDWAEASGIAGLMSHEGVSFWYGARLGHWMWLLDEILWLAVLDRLLGEHPGTRVLELDVGSDPSLVFAARQVAARDGLMTEGAATQVAADSSPIATPAAAAPTRAVSPGRRRGRLARLLARLRPPEPVRRRRLMAAQIAAVEHDPVRRLLVVQAHARQRVETPSGPRLVNTYLGPVVDRLRHTRLDPFEVDIRSKIDDDAAWARLAGPDGSRSLPSDALAFITPATKGLGKVAASAMAARVASTPTPLVVSGVDLGPTLSRRISERIAATQARRIEETAQVRSLLRHLHPAAILIADEYHRQDWMAAAMAEGVPVAAIQHGVIYRWHTGYMHRSRPPELRLPDRTYVFGRWERGLLTGSSVYTPDEVVVGGSPRLDLVRPEDADPAAVRAELRVAEGDRLVVLSGTWGSMYRRFHYPIALARLFARPVERIHLVIKLHPSEQDEGPYRRIVEGLATAAGFAPPPITVVRDVDLYRLLAAADAHLGIHSTVLTEAVAIGTPNLLATGLVAADLLGYIDAGVAIPVETTADLSAALELPRAEAMDPARRAAFLEAHFEPGDASGRIANDLLEWLR